MRLVDHLECVLILDDAEISTREQAFEAILDSMAARGLFSTALVPELLAAIIQRDELGPTGIGEGVAIPHAWHVGLDRMVAALAISRRGLDYGSIDGEPVHILLLILTRPTKESEAAKQETLDGWLRHLRDPAFRADLCLAGTPDELWEVIRREDQPPVRGGEANTPGIAGGGAAPVTASRSRFPVAVVQAASVLFDRDRSTEKAAGLIRQAGAQGARLALLPEAFIPGYPRGLSFGMVVGRRSDQGRRLWQRYWESAVDVPGPATEALGSAAREASVHAAVGVIERDGRQAPGTLYCTLLYFGPDGRLLGKHRKLKPTGSERLIWGEGDGSTLTVLPTELGRIGGLICWENYMPLARMALYGKGVEIYLAPTADARDTWQATLRHIACEGRCFVLGANQYVTRDMYPADLPGLEELAERARGDVPGRQRDHRSPGRGAGRPRLRPRRHPPGRDQPG